MTNTPTKAPRGFSEAQKRNWIKPGECRNPAGRPPTKWTPEQLRAREAAKDLRKVAKEHTAEALDTLLTIMRDPAVAPSSRVAAANSVLDRGHGRSAQHVEVAGNEFSRMSDAELMAFIMGKTVEEVETIRAAVLIDITPEEGEAAEEADQDDED